MKIRGRHDFFFEDFSYRMRTAREAKHLSQRKAAKKAGVSNCALSNIEHGADHYVFGALLLMELYGMKPISVDALGDRLKQLRQDRGMTLDDVARETGLSRPGIYAIESGNVYPCMSSLVLIANALGADPWTFLEA